MSDRYSLAFARLKKQNRLGFCPFAVLGDPNEKETLERVKKYIDGSADFLELGIPFSDPIADGPIIQAATARALKNGTTPKRCIKMIEKIRRLAYRLADSFAEKSRRPVISGQSIPIGILTYANIVLQYSTEKFYRDLKKAGADSVLIADVPLEEIAPFARAAKKHKLHQIFIVSENTDSKRLKKIEKYASGFLYVVSTLGITGARKNLDKNLDKLIRSLSKKTKLPLMIGFGISKPAHMAGLKKAKADGGIVGSTLVATESILLSKKIHVLASACRKI